MTRKSKPSLGEIKDFINKTGIEDVLHSIRYMIDNRQYLDDKKEKIMPLEEIIKIGTEIFEKGEFEIKGPLTHTMQPIQLSILGVACFYNNTDSWKIAKSFNRQGGMCFNAREFIKSAIDVKNGVHPISLLLMKMIAECEKRSGGRIRKNFKLPFSELVNCEVCQYRDRCPTACKFSIDKQACPKMVTGKNLVLADDEKACIYITLYTIYNS